MQHGTWRHNRHSSLHSSPTHNDHEDGGCMIIHSVCKGPITRRVSPSPYPNPKRDKHYKNIVYWSTEQTPLLASLWILNRRFLSPTNGPALQRQFTFPILPYYNESDTASHPSPLPLAAAHYHADTAHQQDVMPTQGRRGRIRSSKQRLSFCRPNMLCRAIHSLGWVHSLRRVSQTLTTPWRALRHVTSDNTSVVGLSQLQPNKNGC